MTTYSKSEVAAILGAYRSLFPRVGSDLSRYWDHSRSRSWSFLTTDFHAVDFGEFEGFSRSVREVAGNEPETIGQRLRELSKASGIGYSLGISPWTDDLLLRTFSERERKIIIVLGHDWYPIVTRDLGYKAGAPLDRFSIYDEPAYGAAVPKDTGAIVLFLNLYPDFRAPGMDQVGSLGDYGPWLKGMDALFEDLSSDREVVGMLSWGKHVWEALQPRLAPEWRDLSVMRAVEVQRDRGRPHELKVGARTVPYWGFAHPSFASNFRRSSHLEAYEAACRSVCRA